jgi:serine/threonine protein kinase
MTKKPVFRNSGILVQYLQGLRTFPASALEEEGVSCSGVEFVSAAMSPSPDRRLTAHSALNHSWIVALQHPGSSFSTSEEPKRTSSLSNLTKEERVGDLMQETFPSPRQAHEVGDVDWHSSNLLTPMSTSNFLRSCRIDISAVTGTYLSSVDGLRSNTGHYESHSSNLAPVPVQKTPQTSTQISSLPFGPRLGGGSRVGPGSMIAHGTIPSAGSKVGPDFTIGSGTTILGARSDIGVGSGVMTSPMIGPGKIISIGSTKTTLGSSYERAVFQLHEAMLGTVVRGEGHDLTIGSVYILVYSSE